MMVYGLGSGILSGAKKKALKVKVLVALIQIHRAVLVVPAHRTKVRKL